MDPLAGERGVRLNSDTLTFIPADTQIRPLRDQMVVEPYGVTHSRVLIVLDTATKLIHGKVLAIGPGLYPRQYDHQERKKRTKTWHGMVFRPTEVKIGDIVHLDGRQTGKAAFEGFYWGNRYCIHAREEDVAGVEVAA